MFICLLTVEVRPKRVKPKVILRDASEFADEGTGYVPGIQRDDATEDDEFEKQEKV